MYYYSIGYHWYEDGDRKVFISEKKINEKELRKLIKKLIDKTTKELLHHREFFDTYIGNAEIIKRVWKVLPEYGFEPVKIEGYFSIFGSGIIESDEKEYRGIMDEEIFQELDKHNKRIKDNLF